MLKGIGAGLLASAVLTAVPVLGQTFKPGDWPQYGGNLGFDRYSSLSQINAKNVSHLHVLWTRPSLDSALLKQYPDLNVGKYFRATPIVIDGIAYAPDGVGLIEAFDAATGKTIWVQKPPSAALSDVAGAPSRGAAFWADGKDRRIISIRGEYLYSLDARTGAPTPGFGDSGRVSLHREGWDRKFTVSGGPLVVNDVIVVGGGEGGDYSFKKKAPPEGVRAFDVRTGRKLWEFSPMPAKGDPNRKTWGAGSAEIAGDMGSYGQISADPALGYVYVPFSAANPPVYGGWRPGNNLYGTSLVALDIKTGRKIWHFQMIHHDIWDWDLSSPPVLGDITVNGKMIKAVMQTGKMPLLFTFDRATGKPVWPIEERPVPAKSDVPGEQLSPTQPFPTKPAALDRIGVTEADLVDFTPELHQEAIDALKNHHYGPAYTPPSMYEEKGNQGTLTLPGTDGGGNWNTGAFDPETHTYYGMTTTAVANYGVVKATEPGADTGFHGVDVDSTFAFFMPDGLPLVKPPYGRITAVDMNSGNKVWTIANGDGPRNDPKLKSLNLPQLGLPGRVAVAVTKNLIFAPEASDTVFLADIQKGSGNKFRAYDKKTGKILAEVTLPAGATGAPVTFLAGGKQMILVAVGSKTTDPQWVALGL